MSCFMPFLFLSIYWAYALPRLAAPSDTFMTASIVTYWREEKSSSIKSVKVISSIGRREIRALRRYGNIGAQGAVHGQTSSESKHPATNYTNHGTSLGPSYHNPYFGNHEQYGKHYDRDQSQTQQMKHQ